MLRLARTFIFLALILAAFLVGVGCAIPEKQIRVHGVVDGDTVEFEILYFPDQPPSEVTCRLARINAPERFTPEGKAATAALGELLASGAVWFEDVGRGGFGRRACEVWVEVPGRGRLNASDELVRLGHAKPWEDQP